MLVGLEGLAERGVSHCFVNPDTVVVAGNEALAITSLLDVVPWEGRVAPSLNPARLAGLAPEVCTPQHSDVVVVRMGSFRLDLNRE